MTDLLFVAIIVAFFLLGIGYMSACAALRGGDNK